MKEELKEFREKAIKLACSVYGLNVFNVHKVLIQTDGNVTVVFDNLKSGLSVCLSPDDINSKDFYGTVLLLKKHKEDKENAIRLREADILAESNRKKLVEEKSMYLKLKAKFEGKNKY